MDTAREFTDRLGALLRAERNTLVEFILALADFDRRELYRSLGYASLFPFLQRELGLSDGLAYYRMKACRLVRDFPEVVEPLPAPAVEARSAAEPKREPEVGIEVLHLVEVGLGLPPLPPSRPRPGARRSSRSRRSWLGITSPSRRACSRSSPRPATRSRT